MFSFPMKLPLQGFSVYTDINRVPLAVQNTGMSSSSMSVSSCDHLGDNPLLSQRASNGYSSFENREQAFNLNRDERLVADLLGRLEYSNHAYAKQMSHAQRNVIPETSTSADLARVPSPVNRIEIGLSLSPMDVSTCETSVIDSLTPENHHFFHLIRRVEASFAKYSSRVDVFDGTLDEVLNTYSFIFPCKEHASEILSYALVYYIRLRMRQNAHQENLKQTKKFVVKKKLAKFTNK
ncbi:uncharacterized protein LOC107270353 [Cephus cinctus]|uniref:Uncharacterized protein LOC107270353 n=1 Tax=Cephus cinctus TaxID=211228 RepID=A0AAJ7C331_CEPCN|nr:uncharacterized protein LOC107270353 [Cephus cinctus]